MGQNNSLTRELIGGGENLPTITLNIRVEKDKFIKKS